jgi:uncharacterized membrane protein
MYNIRALPGPKDATGSKSFGLNKGGDVCGYAYLLDSKGEVLEAYGVIWKATGSPFEMHHYSSSVLYGINDNGDAVGVREWYNTATQIGVVVRGGTVIDLPAALGEGSLCRGINNAGKVVGFPFKGEHSFIYDSISGSHTFINPLPGQSDSYTAAINQPGDVVGRSYQNAFLFSGGVLTDLGPAAYIEGLNDKRVMVGSLDKPVPPYWLPAIWDLNQASPTPEYIPLPPGFWGGHGEGINKWGAVVGTCWTPPQASNPRWCAFVCIGGVSTDLNTLIPDGTGWDLGYAQAINDAGQITGTGTLYGKETAFLLTPEPFDGVDHFPFDDFRIDFADVPTLVATLIFGAVKQGGAGWVTVGGRRIPVPPRGPIGQLPADKRDLLISLAIDELAMHIEDDALRKSVRTSALEAARSQLGKLIENAATRRQEMSAVKSVSRYTAGKLNRPGLPQQN